MSVNQHKREAPDSVGCMVVTVSDTRTEETDRSGQLMIGKLKENGHRITEYKIIKDDYTAVQEAVMEADARVDTAAVLINGGTGIALRDTTFEAAEAILDKTIPGFGELFRYLSYEKDIGPAAMLSRATAGVRGSTAVFSTPGSSGAVRLAMEELIIPELGHVVREIRKDR
ncbi:MogA/MoaB family molybdenum cofactor biosynthesis protein [Alteribacter natronophilus]|uniref:MogA/MoaB family molybdenum cofactor biosynthesis protein n=1 Tax=Alteribacter natronophilus TaxID=2583810 RepID=UPI00110E347B|nr:molybdenum cofactor biosynthesis protein B [Alteribacter natronophilus]TMW73645.1 molybdenum cofactor biosynthesis protein MoaB [Alteribacter natronophilus]